MPWLIEHNTQYFNEPQYFRVDVTEKHEGSRAKITKGFHKDRELAIQFWRRSDAEAFIYLHPDDCLNARAVEVAGL